MKKNIQNCLFPCRVVAAVSGCFMMLFITGCTSVTTISPSTTPITEKDTYTKYARVSGSSSGFMILGIPFMPSEPSRAARDNAIKSGKGNAMIEVTEEYNMLNLLIVAFFWTKVEGTAVQVEHAGEEIE
ncbi:MAG: hypothetical protein WCV67_02155 [Victivallaceae bacterium]|jgi:hypothetical protein